MRRLLTLTGKSCRRRKPSTAGLPNNLHGTDTIRKTGLSNLTSGNCSTLDLNRHEEGDRYLNALKQHEAVIAKNVTANLYERHLKPLLLDK